VAHFDTEASQTRGYCVTKYATHRAAHPDPSLRKQRLLGMTIKLSHYQSIASAKLVMQSSSVYLREIPTGGIQWLAIQKF
jgi:hypothetical protein